MCVCVSEEVMEEREDGMETGNGGERGEEGMGWRQKTTIERRREKEQDENMEVDTSGGKSY